MSALVDGKINRQTHLYEASSGNTAIGEAYFARLLGLKFTAVMRPGVSEGKLRAIRGYGGNEQILPEGVSPASFINHVLENNPDAYDLNQFANAEKALDFFEGSPAATMNIANEIYGQLRNSDHPCPTWFVVGAGSGGTATSIARYLRKWSGFSSNGCFSQLVVVDPEDSVLYSWFKDGDPNVKINKGSRIEGIGSRGPVQFGSTFSLLREGVSRMIKVPDADSVAAMHLTSKLIGQDVGPSTGTNLCGALRLASAMHRRGQAGAIVTIICDEGSRYQKNYYDPQWINNAGLSYDLQLRQLEKFWISGNTT